MHRIVGLDQAQDGVRVAILQGGFRGFALQEVRAASYPEQGNAAERLAGALAALGLQPPLSADDAVAVALPDALVATHLIDLPFTDPKRIEQVLPAEVEAAIPFDLSEVVWDFSVLGQAGTRTEVLVGIVRKSVLKEHLDALAAAGVEPRVVTLAPLALAALGERGLLQAGPEPLSAALLEAGPDRADLAVTDGGRLVLARALATANTQAWHAAQGDEAARARLLSNLSRDLKISLRARKAAPQKLLLSGPLATLPDAAARLGAELQLPAETAQLPAGDPGAALALGLAYLCGSEADSAMRSTACATIRATLDAA